MLLIFFVSHDIVKAAKGDYGYSTETNANPPGVAAPGGFLSVCGGPGRLERKHLQENAIPLKRYNAIALKHYNIILQKLPTRKTSCGELCNNHRKLFKASFTTLPIGLPVVSAVAFRRE